MSNEAMRNSLGTIEIQSVLERIGDIHSAISKKVRPNIDATIKDRNMCACADLTEKGTDPRGLWVKTKSGPAVREDSGFEQKEAQATLSPKKPKIEEDNHKPSSGSKSAFPDKNPYPNGQLNHEALNWGLGNDCDYHHWDAFNHQKSYRRLRKSPRNTNRDSFGPFSWE